MKKTICLFVGAISMLFALNSCKQSDDEDSTLKFSTLSVEKQKQSIEQNGIDLVDQLDGLKDAKAFTALQTFENNTNQSVLFVKPLVQLRTNLLRNDTKALETFSQQLKVAAVLADGKWGTYTWNQLKEDFDFVKGANYSAKILFPATENSLVNSGEITIIYAESTVKVPDSDPIEYMPKSISAVMKVSGTTALTFNFDGAYKSDATPTSISQTLVVEKFTWNVSLNNNNTDLSAKYSFTCDKNVLLKLEIGAAGSLTAKNIQNNIDDNPENVLSSGAVSFQVMNIAMKGSIDDFKSLVSDAKAHKPDSITKTYTDWYGTVYTYKEADYNKAYYDKSSAIINKYLKIYGYFANENKKFADVEFYTCESSYTYNDWVWNNTKQTYEIVPVTETNYEVQPRFVLSDGSKVAIDEYVKTGFDDLISKLENY